MNCKKLARKFLNTKYGIINRVPHFKYLARNNTGWISLDWIRCQTKSDVTKWT